MVQIKVEQFEGPLDLLLQLIEEQKLDITTVSLAAVTEQFLQYVKNLPAPTSSDFSGRGGQEKNPNVLADFLVIAAKLLVIKSKALLPDLDLGIEDEETATDLTAKLLLYKKFKEAAKYFKRLDLKRKQSWSREADFESSITFLPSPELTPQTLASSLSKLAAELKEIMRLPQEILKEVISINEKISHIQQIIESKLETSLSELIKSSKSKIEVIVTFLALLELIKQRILTVEQNDLFEEITIRKISNN